MQQPGSSQDKVLNEFKEDTNSVLLGTCLLYTSARESIRDKLKSAQKAQPPHTPKPQKNKGKDMELLSLIHILKRHAQGR